jgi:hypothetical protein
MGDAYTIISSITGCFVQVFGAIFSTNFWCGFSWGDICITFLALDILLGFVLWLINHPYQRAEEKPDTSYHGPDAKAPAGEGWYKGLYAKSGETYESRWD